MTEPKTLAAVFEPNEEERARLEADESNRRHRPRIPVDVPGLGG